MVEPFMWANVNVRELKPYQGGKSISALQRELGIEQVIKLASNENPLGASSKVTKRLREYDWYLARYPEEGGFELKQALAEFWSIQPDQLTLGAGSEELIRFIIQAFVGVGESILIPQYSFIAYEIVAKALGIGVKKVLLNNWHVDVPAMIEAWHPGIKVIFMANPGNPIGTFIDEHAFQDLLAYLPTDVIVVMDEAYFEYVHEVNYPDTLSSLSAYPNLIITRTFSKAYGLAGLRVGYSISHPKIADLLNRIRGPYNITAIGLMAAKWALLDQDHVHKSEALNNKGLDKLKAYFNNEKIPYFPSCGNFITFKVGPKALTLFQALLKKGIIVRPLLPYGLDEYLRVTVGTDKEIQAFIEAFRDCYHCAVNNV